MTSSVSRAAVSSEACLRTRLPPSSPVLPKVLAEFSFLGQQGGDPWVPPTGQSHGRFASLGPAGECPQHAESHRGSCLPSWLNSVDLKNSTGATRIEAPGGGNDWGSPRGCSAPAHASQQTPQGPLWGLGGGWCWLPLKCTRGQISYAERHLQLQTPGWLQVPHFTSTSDICGVLPRSTSKL